MGEGGKHGDLCDVSETDDGVTDGSSGTDRHQDPFFRLRDPFRLAGGGTFAPFFLASLSPIAIACLRLLTTRPEPLFSVPRFRRCRADFTVFDADFPYFAI
jgi:hypothetical protein